MSCVLTIRGKDFNVDRFIEQSGILPYRKWYKGEPKSKLKPEGKIMADSGCSVDVSKADFDEFRKQLKDAKAFLELNSEQLKHIKMTSTIVHADFDFGINYNIDKFVQSHYFPPDFLRSLAELGIGLELSIYGKAE